MPDPNYVLFPEHGIAFFGLCKNANTSIKRAFLKSMGIETDGPHRPDLLTYVSAGEIACSDIWSFAIVRDPYDRLLSCWRDKCFGGWKNSGIRWGLSEGMPFAAFIGRICAIPDAKSISLGQHWRSQAWDLLYEGQLVPDFIGRFERLDEAWSVVRAHSMVPLPDLGHENRTEPGPDPYTPELRAKVAERYRQDFEIFGYDA